MHTQVSMVNISFAFSPLPMPKFFEIKAVPPVPTMKPSVPNTIRYGMIRLMAVKGVFPAKFDTKIPSTTP